MGAVFEGNPGRERSDLVPGVFLDEPGPITYVAQRLPVEEFGRFLYALAQRCGLDRAREVVILGDGARWMRHIVEEHFPHAVQIVDLYHAREHLWNVANAVYGPGTPQGAVWAKPADDLLSHGKIEELIQMIEKLPSIPAVPGASRCIPAIEAEYFLSNAKPHALSDLSGTRHAYWQWHCRGGLQNRGLHPCQKIRHAASLPMAWLRSSLCALAFSTSPMTRSGRTNMLLDCLQLFHTP